MTRPVLALASGFAAAVVMAHLAGCDNSICHHSSSLKAGNYSLSALHESLYEASMRKFSPDNYQLTVGEGFHTVEESLVLDGKRYRLTYQVTGFQRF